MHRRSSNIIQNMYLVQTHHLRHITQAYGPTEFLIRWKSLNTVRSPLYSWVLISNTKSIDLEISVSGKDGVAGHNGTKGLDGRSARKGTDGTNGRSGGNGTNGGSGSRGSSGTPGTHGANGTDLTVLLEGSPSDFRVYYNNTFISSRLGSKSFHVESKGGDGGDGGHGGAGGNGAAGFVSTAFISFY